MYSLGSTTILEYELTSSHSYLENTTEVIIDMDANDGAGGNIDISVSYSLAGTDSHLFTIDDSGIVSFKISPDFEQPLDEDSDNEYSFHVVIDNTNDRIQQRILVSVNDVNDTPTFTYTGKNFDVTTATYAGSSQSLYTAKTPVDVAFSNDGRKLFAIGTSYGGVAEYQLETPYALPTADYEGPSKRLSFGSVVRSPQSIVFNPDGTKLFITASNRFNNGTIFEYGLSEAFEISSALYRGELRVRDQDVDPRATAFNANGTKMFVVGRRDDYIVAYDLLTPYDISTATYSGLEEEFFVGDEIYDPEDLAFDDQGMRMFLIGIEEEIVQYGLRSPYDLATAYYVGVAGTYEVGGQTFNDDGFLEFNATGTEMFVQLGRESIEKFKLASTINYLENSVGPVLDIDARNGTEGDTDASVTYSLDGPDAGAFAIDALGSISFLESPDYERPHDADSNNIYQITVLIARANHQSTQKLEISVEDASDIPAFSFIGHGFDISRASYTGTLEDFYPEFNPHIHFLKSRFSADGRKLIILGNNKELIEYRLTSPFDVSSAHYAGPYEEYDVGNEVTSPRIFTFDDTGTELYVIDESGSVLKYSLEIAFDITSITYSAEEQGFSFGNEVGSPISVSFGKDGSLFFVLEEDGNVIEFVLATPYDVTTATYQGRSEELGIRELESPYSLSFNEDGTKLLVLGSETIAAYLLSTPYDVSSAFHLGESEHYDPENSGSMLFSHDGTLMYLFRRNQVHLHELPSSPRYPENSLEAVIDIDANDGAGGSPDVSVTYSLTGVDAELFKIDAAGVLSFIKTPDFERPHDTNLDNTYELTVIASNSFETNAKRLEVAVTDELDKPIFTFVGTGFDVSTAAYAGPLEEYLVTEDADPYGMSFSADGTKLFVLGSGREVVLEYTLQIPYDVSTAKYAGKSEQFYFGSEEPNPVDIAFNEEGTKMFILGTKGIILAYQLTTGYDVSSASYSGEAESLNVVAREPNARAVNFNENGSILYVIGAGNDIVIAYELENPYEISTAIYAGKSKEFRASSEEAVTTDMSFNSDGTKMFVVGYSGRSVAEYILPTAYDVSTAIYLGKSEEFSLDPYYRGISFTPDGTEMLVIGTNSIVEYSIASSFDYPENSTSSIVDIDANDGFGGSTDTSVVYSLTGEDAALFHISPAGVLSFKNSPNFENPLDFGMDNRYNLTVVASNQYEPLEQRVQVVIHNTDDTPVFTYFGETFDISTAKYSGFSESLYVGDEESDPATIKFNNDGTKMFVIGWADDFIVEYILKEAYDISTAFHTGGGQEFYVGDQESYPRDLAFNDLGTKMYVIGTDGARIFVYDISVPFDISTATYAGFSASLGVVGQESYPVGLAFNNNGSKLFVVGREDDAIVEYDLSVPYEVSTAIHAGNLEELRIGSEDQYPSAITFSSDGTKLFLTGFSLFKIAEYHLTDAFDISSGSYTGYKEELYVGEEEFEPYGMVFNPTGTNMYLIGTSANSIIEYELAGSVFYYANGSLAVIDINATDGLGGSDDEGISYSLQGVDAGLFTVGTSGLISAVERLSIETPKDHDLDNSYLLTVIAQSQTDQSRQKIQITVTNDANDVLLAGETPIVEPPIYPNPTNLHFSINQKMTVLGQVIIEDIQGKKIKDFSSSNKNFYDISDLAPGIYYVSFLTKNQLVVREKLMIK